MNPFVEEGQKKENTPRWVVASFCGPLGKRLYFLVAIMQSLAPFLATPKRQQQAIGSIKR